MELCCLTSENHLKMFGCVGASRGCAGAPARFLLTIFIFGNMIKMMTRAKVVPPPSSMTSTFKQSESPPLPRQKGHQDPMTSATANFSPISPWKSTNYSALYSSCRQLFEKFKFGAVDVGTFKWRPTWSQSQLSF